MTSPSRKGRRWPLGSGFGPRPSPTEVAREICPVSPERDSCVPCTGKSVLFAVRRNKDARPRRVLTDCVFVVLRQSSPASGVPYLSAGFFRMSVALRHPGFNNSPDVLRRLFSPLVELGNLSSGFLCWGLSLMGLRQAPSCFFRDSVRAVRKRNGKVQTVLVRNVRRYVLELSGRQLANGDFVQSLKSKLTVLIVRILHVNVPVCATLQLTTMLRLALHPVNRLPEIILGANRYLVDVSVFHGRLLSGTESAHCMCGEPAKETVQRALSSRIVTARSFLGNSIVHQWKTCVNN